MSQQQSQTKSTFPSWIEANLEKDFHFNKYLCKAAELEWAQRLGLTTDQVSAWFENRRKRHEREMALRPKVVPPPSPPSLVVITDPRIAELELEKEFHFNSCIWENRVAEFATKFSMTADQVRAWFKNRRQLARDGWQMINEWDVPSDDESSLKQGLKSTRGIPRPHKLIPRS